MLVPFNYLLEALKWQSFLNEIRPIRLSTAMLAICRGVSIGIITPARIGEYLGRSINLDSDEERYQSIMATLLGSIAQNLITIIAGVIAIYVAFQYMSIIGLDYAYSTRIFLLVVVMILLLVYYNKTIFVWLNDRITNPLGNRFIHVMVSVNNGVKHKILLFSAIRYIIYWSQYVFILHFFNIPLGIIEGGIGVGIIYLVQTGLPLPGSLALLARSSIAMAVFSLWEINEITILLASWTLWVLNLMIPALFGVVLIFKVRKFG